MSNYSNDFIFQAINTLWLTRHLDENTDHKYAENLVLCDKFAYANSIHNGFNGDKIKKDFVRFISNSESNYTDLNKLRVHEIHNWDK